MSFFVRFIVKIKSLLPRQKISNKLPYGRKRFFITVLIGFIFGASFIIFSNKAIKYTSTNQFCMSCHIHPHADDSWKISTHYDNKSGIIVNCVECHLPPPGTVRHLNAKVTTGIRDVYGKLFKDEAKINWEAKRQLSNAVKHTYQESCKGCHQNLFPRQISNEGLQAHLYYTNNESDLNCLNCHLHVGHYSEDSGHKMDFGYFKAEAEAAEIYSQAAVVKLFEQFTEYIPGTSVKFKMLPIPGGVFQMGSPDNEPGRLSNEGPVREVEVSPFFMAEIEVTWDMYMAFFRETASEGRSVQQTKPFSTDLPVDVDAISGPTPPWGNPDQGWGFGINPAITMTHHAAETFCKWLSVKTGKSYRLPTEAEWEFAARGGTTTPYFFLGNPAKYTQRTFWNRLFGADTTTINTYVIYAGNSQQRIQSPEIVAANPYGLKNMLGSVWEFCSDFYADDILQQYSGSDIIKNPTGPSFGTERVIRGGSFKSDAFDVRVARREQTRHDAWLQTDPQIPKSIWWYSDNNEVGFRVVLSWSENQYKSHLSKK